MKNHKLLFLALCCSSSFLMGCNNSTPQPEPTPEPEPVIPEEKVVTPIKILSPAKDAAVRTYSSSIDSYLDATTDNERILALRNGAKTDAGAIPVTLSWESNGSANYTVTVSENEDLSNSKDYLVSGLTPRLHLYNLCPNQTYYWNVKGNENGDTSEKSSFVTLNKTVRFIYASGGSNIRDIGGWKTSEGKSINYGMIYRGNCLNGYSNIATLTADGIDTFVNQLGMKTEIDFRTSGSDDLNQNANWFNPNGKYLKATIGQYTQLFDSITWNAIKLENPSQVNGSGPSIESVLSIKNVFETLSDINNYPVYMHCNVGADRTGSMAFLINGLLGVSYDDLARDYELTTYSSKSGERYRSEVLMNQNTGEYYYSDSGVCPVTGNFIAFDAFYKNMVKYYGSNGTISLSQAIEKYLTQYIGISKETIVKVKNILIKDYHDDTYDNVVTLENRQDIDLSSAKKSISLGDAVYKAIDDIEYNGISLGKDITNLNLDSVNNPSGDDNIYVHATGLLDNKIIYKVPVTFVTEIITSMTRFKEIFDVYNNDTYYGYYKLGCDIGTKDDSFSDKAQFSGMDTWSTGKGFNGTLDGCGYTIRGTSSNRGLFTVLGINSEIKNVNIENYKYISGGTKQHTTLAISIFGKLTNINIKLLDGPTSKIDVHNWFGFVSTSFAQNMVVNNLSIDAEGFYLDSLFGGTNTGGYFANKNKFENLSVTCKEIEELGHYGLNQYSILSVDSLSGSFTYRSSEQNTVYTNSTVGQIYLGSQFEGDFALVKVEYNGIDCGQGVLEDGEITLNLGTWFPKSETSMDLDVLLTNLNGLIITVKLTVSIVQSN